MLFRDIPKDVSFFVFMPNNLSVVDVKPVNQSVVDTKPLNKDIIDTTTIYLETRTIAQGQWIPFVGFTYPTTLTFQAQRL